MPKLAPNAILPYSSAYLAVEIFDKILPPDIRVKSKVRPRHRSITWDRIPLAQAAKALEALVDAGIPHEAISRIAGQTRHYTIRIATLHEFDLYEARQKIAATKPETDLAKLTLKQRFEADRQRVITMIGRLKYENEYARDFIAELLGKMQRPYGGGDND